MNRAQLAEQSIRKKYRKQIWCRFVRGVSEYKLIEEGDRVAVCISGGKDSMLLAKCLQELKRHWLVNFEVKFFALDPGYTPANRQRILDNAELLGIPLEIYDAPIFGYVTTLPKSPCYMCARMRRGYLYSHARDLGCNKIALGHHFDDVIETILMSMLYGAQVRTMMPKLHSTNFRGMELIRPLYYVKEEDIISWKNRNGLEFLQCACKFTEDNAIGVGKSKRQEIKQMISELRKINKDIDINIFRSMYNVNLETVISYVQGGREHMFQSKQKYKFSSRGRMKIWNRKRKYVFLWAVRIKRETRRK